MASLLTNKLQFFVSYTFVFLPGNFHLSNQNFVLYYPSNSGKYDSSYCKNGTFCPKSP